MIVDGAKEMPLKEDDDTELTFAERIKNRKTKPGEKGMERHAYALLMMESLRKGEPIDKDTYTLLDDDPALSASGVPRTGTMTFGGCASMRTALALSLAPRGCGLWWGVMWC